MKCVCRLEGAATGAANGRTGEMRKFNQNTGAVMTELALALGLLLMLAGGLMDFGMALYQQSVIVNAARVGARTAAAVQDLVSSGAADELSAVARSAADEYLKSAGLFGGSARVNARTVAQALPAGRSAYLIEVSICIPSTERFSFSRRFAFSGRAAASFRLEGDYVVGTGAPPALCS